MEYFQSCAEYGGNRQEVVWMNYESFSQMSIIDFPEVMP